MIKTWADWLRLNDRLMTKWPDDIMDDPDIAHTMISHKNRKHEKLTLTRLGWKPLFDCNERHQQFYLALAYMAFGEGFFKCKTYVEIGAGLGDMYKAMLQLPLNLRYKFHYTVFDLPTISKLSKERLKGYDIKWVDYPQSLNRRIVVYEPSIALIAMFSLAEMSIPDREMIMASGDYDYYLFGYNPTWGDIDNVKWFEELKAKLTDVEWKQMEPRFLVGRRK